MRTSIDEFIGVYDADSTFRGEISYWIGARLGQRHCSLCDITHGLFTVRKDWNQCASKLSIPFITYHRNDAPPDVLKIANGNFPIVLARRGQELEIVAARKQLEDFDSSVHKFEEFLTSLLS